MLFKDYFSSLNADQKRDLANACDTSVPYLSQIAHGHSTSGKFMALKIETHTNSSVNRETVRPDINWATFRNSLED